MAGLQDGVANLIASITGGAGTQQRAMTAEQARLTQVQQEREQLAKMAADAVFAANRAGGSTGIANNAAMPQWQRDLILAGGGSDYKSVMEGSGVAQQNQVRQLSVDDILKGIPTSPDELNRRNAVANDTMLVPANVRVDDQSAGIVDKLLAETATQGAQAGKYRAEASLANAKIPFVGQGGGTGRAPGFQERLFNQLPPDEQALAARTTLGLAPRATEQGVKNAAERSKADTFKSSALATLDLLDQLDAEGVGGPIAGRITPAWAGEVGQKIEQYGKLAASFRGDLQRLQRVVGVGSQSDRELAELIAASQEPTQTPETRKVLSGLIRRKLEDMGARGYDFGGDAGAAAPLGGGAGVIDAGDGWSIRVKQ
jgi:hypothetical protein